MRDLLLKDWAWKLFSLFLAAIIWFTVHGIIEPETVPPTGNPALTFDNMAVHVISSTNDASLYHTTPAVVRVKISAPQDVMNRLRPSQVRAEVDLADSNGGVGAVNIITPPAVTLVEVEPSTVVIVPPPKH